MQIKIRNEDVQDAVKEGLLREAQGDDLWAFFLRRRSSGSPILNGLALFGTLIVLASMTWFAARVFSESNRWLLLTTGAVYFALFLTAGLLLRRRGTFPIPTALSLTMAVLMATLTVYAAQRMWGASELTFPSEGHDFVGWYQKGLFWLEWTILTVAALFLWRFGNELLVVPLSVAAWFLVMDLVPLFLARELGSDGGRLVSMAIGLGLLVVSRALDRPQRERDLSFWLYLVGLVALWTPAFSESAGLFEKLGYLAFNLVLIFLALRLRRVAFLAFGTLGVFLFLFDLLGNVFRESLLFPVYLSLVGLALVGLAVFLFRRTSLEGHKS